MRKNIIIVLCLFLFTTDVQGECLSGTVFNPMTDVCFECIFPLKISGVPVMPGPFYNQLPVMADSPVCKCPTIANPPGVRIGIPVSFWSPDRVVDSVIDKFCFPAVGLSIGSPTPEGSGGTKQEENSDANKTGKFQTHLYIYPVLSILKIATDIACLEPESIDLAYISEVDPLWQDDELADMFFPETIVFANPIAKLACTVESISTLGFFSISPLFWCVGGLGSTYPPTGNVNAATYLGSNHLAAARLVFREARMGLWWDYALNYCFPIPTILWVKHNMRVQLSKPIRSFTCNPWGQTSMIWGLGTNIPYGVNKSYLVFKRIGCCAF